MCTTFGVALACLAVAPVAAGAVVTVGNGNGYPGFGLVAVPIVLDVGPGEQVAAAQWDLSFVGSAFSMGYVIAGPCALEAGKSVSFSTIRPGLVRMIVVGMNLDVMAGGLVATAVLVPSSAAGGGDFVLEPTNLSISNPYGVPLAAFGASGIVSLDAESLPAVTPDRLGLVIPSGLLLLAGILWCRRYGGSQCAAGT